MELFQHILFARIVGRAASFLYLKKIKFYRDGHQDPLRFDIYC